MIWDEKPVNPLNPLSFLERFKPAFNRALSQKNAEPLSEETKDRLRQLVPVTDYASNHLLVPALLNTPLTTSLYRPLVISQCDGQNPNLQNIRSTSGWGTGLVKSGVRYAIADTSKLAACQILFGVDNTNKLPIEEKAKADWQVNAFSSLMMTVASQPLTVIQINREVPDAMARQSYEQQFKQSLDVVFKRPFNGSVGNFTTTLLNFALDTNDRNLIKEREQGKKTYLQTTLIQITLGAGVGFLNNFLKTHAHRRARGKSNREIFDFIKSTAKENPRLFAYQLLYSTAAGCISNLLWANTLLGIKTLDDWVKDQANDKN